MDVKETIEKRRAYRNIEGVEITGDLVQDLALSASLAPSCYNKQPWRFIFVLKKERLEQLMTALPRGNAWAQNASLIVAVASRKDLDCLLDNREYFLFDAGIATGFLVLRATELNLVCHPIAGYDQQKVKTILSVPDDMTVITLLIIGQKSNKPNPLLSEKALAEESQRPPRKNFDEFAFFDEYRQ